MKYDPRELLREYAEKARGFDMGELRDKLGSMCRGPIKKAWDDVQLLWQMVRDPEAPKRSKAVAIGALVYLISPIDIIPDAIPVLGLTDDASVIAYAVRSLAADLERYRGTKK